jgi:hypothetical protein
MIDLKGGAVVRARYNTRHSYAPIVTPAMWCSKNSPRTTNCFITRLSRRQFSRAKMAFRCAASVPARVLVMTRARVGGDAGPDMDRRDALCRGWPSRRLRSCAAETSGHKGIPRRLRAARWPVDRRRFYRGGGEKAPETQNKKGPRPLYVVGQGPFMLLAAQFGAKGCFATLRWATTWAGVGSPLTARAIASFVA